MKFSIWLTRWLFACRVMRRRKAIRAWKNALSSLTNRQLEKALFGNHMDVRTRRPV